MNKGHYIHPNESSKLIQCAVSKSTPTYTLIESITEHTYHSDSST